MGDTLTKLPPACLLLFVFAWGALALPLAAQPDSENDRPNVVFILADDLGWSDTGIYGSNYYETPHIDRLAERGMLFTQAYAANPLCSPTRASILTGQWPSRIGMTTAAGHRPRVRMESSLAEEAAPTERALPAQSVTRLDTTYYTLAEAFRDAGYTTGHFGKWHVGHEPYDPLHQGFDVAIPNSPAPGPGSGGYLAPWSVWPGHGEPGEHLEDRMAEEAADFIRKNSDRPFFLNYWAWSVHSPWEAEPERVEKWAGRASPYELQHNPVYAAMVQSLDEAVGTLMQTLEEQGVSDDTIVVFTSDNGGWIWPIARWSDPGKYANIPVTDNVPLRGGKATIYEGGTRVPLIAVWPGRIEAGTTNHTDIVRAYAVEERFSSVW